MVLQIGCSHNLWACISSPSRQRVFNNGFLQINKEILSLDGLIICNLFTFILS